jgi:hypothetical protein
VAFLSADVEERRASLAVGGASTSYHVGTLTKQSMVMDDPQNHSSSSNSQQSLIPNNYSVAQSPNAYCFQNKPCQITKGDIEDEKDHSTSMFYL